MYILVTYDVCTESLEGQKRLRKVAKVCQDHGQRVQNSVFECAVTESQYIQLKELLRNIIDKNMDSIRFYRLGKSASLCIEHLGIETAFNMEEELII